jgi:tetrahydromethanopterin S-methyltransferase subunit G
MDENRIAARVWLRAIALPWAIKHWAIWATPIIAATGICFGIMGWGDRELLWWLSLTMQALGLILSLGAVISTALEMKAENPWKTLKKAIAEFPKYRRAKIVYGYANLILPGPRMYATGHVNLPADATDSQRIAYLMKSLRELETTAGSTFRRIEERFLTVTEKIESLEQATSQKHKEIEQRIRGVSVGSFYQVLSGLILLSIGSIISLFL